MQVGIQITKKTLFRGVQQEFHNVYHYELPTAVSAPAEALIDAVVAIERDFHSTDVTFVKGSCWKSGGSPLQNEMLFQKALTGTGNQATSPDLDRERAFLIRWPAGKDSKGRNVYLRKYYHSCGGFAGQGLSTAQRANTAGFSSAERAAQATSANRLKTIHAELWQICAESGRRPSGDAEAHQYLEHHQLGDQWRS